MTECDEKESVLYPSEKLILFLVQFDFWGGLNVIMNWDLWIIDVSCYENGKHLQKTMQTLA